MILGGDPFKADPTNNPVIDLLDISLGNAGNDYIDGEGFVDLSFGGNGNDVVKGGNNRDENAANIDVNVSFGDQDNDCVLGGGVAEVLIGGAGDDILWNSGLIGVHLGLGGEDISFGGDFLLNSDIVLGDAGVDRANLLGGPDLVFGFGGADHIKSDVALIAFAGDDDDRVQGGVSNIIFGGDGNDHLGVQTVGQVNPLSVIFGGSGNDKTQGGSFGFGNDGNDQMQDHGLSFGGQGADRIKSRENMLVPFSLMMGGANNDMLMTSTDENSRDLGFGNKGDDKFDYGPGKNRAWGGKGDDEMTGFYEPQSGTDKRDKLRGGRDTDSAWGNSNDDPKKDKLKAESKNRGSGPTWAPLTAPTAPTPPTVSQPSCPQPTDFDRFKGATQVGSKLAYQDWMNDFWED